MRHDWTPPKDPERRARDVAFYVSVLERDFLDPYSTEMYVARLNCCLGHELTSDGIPWLDIAQVQWNGRSDASA